MSSKQRSANRFITQDRFLEQWLRQFGIAPAHGVTEDDARVPDDRREAFALALLARALALINRRSKPRAISLLGMPDGDPMLQFDYLISRFEQRRPRKRPRKTRKPAGKRGAPRKWTRNAKALLVRLTEGGRAALQEKGVTRVSNKAALTEGVRRLWREMNKQFSEHELRQFVERKLRRRISEAKQAS